MDSYPIVITLGAALLGLIAGSMAISDISMPTVPAWAHYAVGAVGVSLVLMIGKLIVSWDKAGGDKSATERSE